MGAQGVRTASAVLMAAGVLVALVGVVLADEAVRHIDQQARALDPDEHRFRAAYETAGGGALVALAGLGVFLVALLALGLATWRARRVGTLVAQPASGLAWGASVALALILLFALVAPQGPGALALSLVSGGGGAAGGTQIVIYNGTLTGAGGPPTGPEDVYLLHPVASEGALRMRVGSGGSVPGAVAVATIETHDGAGGWRLVTQAKGPDSTVDVPRAAYAGDLRVRVHLDGTSLGRVDYVVAVSFAPRA